MLTDTHCHLYTEYYNNDIEKILENAKNIGITRCINSGCSNKSNIEVIKLAEQYENIYATIGIHPENVTNYKQSDLKFIEDNIKNKKVLAIGEIGLDYHYSNEYKKEQIELFEAQLKIAEKNHIPVVIHSREATEDTINILKKYNLKGIIHSFSGSYETAKIYIEMGYLLGVNGVITFKNSKIKEVYKKIDLNNIVLETDSPYLTPHPNRGKRNEPKNIRDIALFLSELYSVDLGTLAEITNANINGIFDI